MIVALRLEVNVIAICILIILIQNKRHIGKNMLDEHLYQILLYVSLLYAVVDSIAWFIDGRLYEHILFALYTVNILCYLCCVIVPYIWTLYAEFRLFEDEEKLCWMNRFFAPPVIIYILLVLATPFTGWMFSFNEKQMYMRGPLFVLQVVLSSFYVIFPTFRAVIRLRKTSVASERKECYSIGVFVLFPLLGLIVQVLYYGIPAAIIATVVAELMIFINIQNKQISLDALTSLNNRGQLNRYLNIQSKKKLRQGYLYMLLLDIDRFKSINDTYGHKVGDQALIDIAVILQKVCGKRGGFLARYGGDEFAIIIEKKSSSEIDQLVEDIQSEVTKFNVSGKRAYKLSTSIGYALFGTDSTQTVDKLIEAADSQMYKMKVKRHAEQGR